MSRGPDQTLFPKRYTNDQWIYEKTLKFTNPKASLTAKNMP